MIALGIDQSMEGVAGFAVIDLEANTILHTRIETYAQDRNKNLVDRTKRIPKNDIRWRCTRFAIIVQELIKTWVPDIVITELVRTYHQGYRDPVVVASLSAIYGALCLVVQKPIPIVSENTGTWQSAILHPRKGQDRKALSRAFVLKYYGLTVTEHEADAICMCRAYPILLNDHAVMNNKDCIRILV